MKEKFELLIHFIVALIKLSKPGGVKALMAENQLLRQQLIVLNRGRVRAPSLKPFDRFFFGSLAFFIGDQRLKKVTIALKPATILKFHKALIQRKYSRLFSNKLNIADYQIKSLKESLKIKHSLIWWLQ